MRTRRATSSCSIPCGATAVAIDSNQSSCMTHLAALTAALQVVLGPRPLGAFLVERHRLVGDDHAEGGANGAGNQVDLAAVGAHELGGDGEAEPRAAAPRRSLERLEKMLARHLPHRPPRVG